MLWRWVRAPVRFPPAEPDPPGVYVDPPRVTGAPRPHGDDGAGIPHVEHVGRQGDAAASSGAGRHVIRGREDSRLAREVKVLARCGDVPGVEVDGGGADGNTPGPAGSLGHG